MPHRQPSPQTPSPASSFAYPPSSPHRLPRLWLMTDERLGDSLWEAIGRLPPGSGIVVRHYTLPPGERRALVRRIARIGQARRLLVVGSGLAAPMGTHHGHRRGRILTHPVHNAREAAAAARAGADLAFVSPVYPTASHPGGRTLGARRLAALIRPLPMPAIAMGGMNARRARAVARLGVYGWAGIDAFAGRQKRKAVPT